jgi:hypothetical protein
VADQHRIALLIGDHFPSSGFRSLNPAQRTSVTVFTHLNSSDEDDNEQRTVERGCEILPKVGRPDACNVLI